MSPHIVIFGANGFLGRYLARRYARRGWEVVCIGRRREGWSGDGMFLEWDGSSDGPWSLALEGAELVINLAGASVSRRHDAAGRDEILRSRIETTEAIGRAVAASRNPPKLWLNMSSVEWYRDAEDAAQDEWRGEPGEDFGATVAQLWEQAFFAIKVPGVTRKIALRAGMILANEPDSAFAELCKLTRGGLGGRMGGGRQRVSWIHLDDFAESIDFLARDGFTDGVVNTTAPHATENRDMMRTFREALSVPAGLPLPRWAVKLGARLRSTEACLMLKSRWAEPRRLREAGFVWRWPSLDKALADLALRPGLEGFFRQPERRSVGVRIWTPGKKVTAASGRWDGT